MAFVAFHVPYSDDKWMATGFTLHNEGPFPVEVDQIGYPTDAGSPVKQVSVAISAPDEAWGPGIPERMIPFRPFTLGSGEARYVLIRHEFFGCTLSGSPESAITWAWETIRFRIRLGLVAIHRSEQLPLSYSVYVTGREGCPN